MVNNNRFHSHSRVPNKPECGGEEVISSLSSQTSQCHVIDTEPRTLAQELGSRRFMARNYLPRIGLWLSSARLQEQLMGEHPYSYVEDNPVNYVDPSGLITLAERDQAWNLAKNCGFSCKVQKSTGHIKCTKLLSTGKVVSALIPGVHPGQDYMKLKGALKTINEHCKDKGPKPKPVVCPAPKLIPCPKKKKGWKKYYLPVEAGAAVTAFAKGVAASLGLVIVGAITAYVVLNDGTVILVADDGLLIPLGGAACWLTGILQDLEA